MTISIKQGNLNVAIDLEENDFDKSVSCEELMLAAFDIISRIFSDKAVVRANYRLDPDTMDFRSEDDPVTKMLPEYLKN